MSYVPLHCHSNYSLLYGTAFTGQLIEKARRLGYNALALTDTDAIYGLVEFYRKARQAQIKPLVGANLTTTCGDLVCLPENAEGYKNLCRLITRRQLGEERLHAEMLAEDHKDLIVLAKPEAEIGILRDIFRSNLYIKLEIFKNSRNHVQIETGLKLARKFSLKTVAANPVVFAEHKDFDLHRILSAIKYGKTIGSLLPVECAHPESFLNDPEQIEQLFHHLPQALVNQNEIVERINLNLTDNDYIFPPLELPEGEAPESVLRRMCLAGLERRGCDLEGRYLSQLDYELGMIDQTGFTSYFLAVADIVDFCHREHIPCVGRGSAASSLVSYALGITHVDPLENDLYFQRFLHEGRADPPDIDIDLCWKNRDRVIDYVYRKYGEKRVAMISSTIRMQSRMAVREVGKALGVPEQDIGKIADRLPHAFFAGIKDKRERFPKIAGVRTDSEPYRTIFKYARRLIDFPRHLGIHPGGIVISEDDLTGRVALERSTKGPVVTQLDMYSIEQTGLIKIDLLGQRSLTVLRETANHLGYGSPADVVRDDDPKTYKLLREGRTLGNFQIESPGMRAMLRDIQPDCLNDLTLALSLIRPGATDSGAKKLFLERYRKNRPTENVYPLIEPILRESCGTIIYQEQVLKIAEAVAGFSASEADRLRKAMSKARSREEMASLKKSFLAGAQQKGVDPRIANNIYTAIAYFASYGFCKAHAASYALVSYQAACLKAHFPVVYMTCVINNHAGYYPSAVYVEEARRLGAKIVPPCVNSSGIESTTDGKTLRLGLMFVKSLAVDVMEQVMTSRKQEGDFESLEDFLWRIDVPKGEVENLIKCGAFDFTGKVRPELLWELSFLYQPIAKAKRDPLPPLFDRRERIKKPDRLPSLDNYTDFEKWLYEQEILEVSAGCHPLTLFGQTVEDAVTPHLHKLNNRKVNTRGWLADIKRINTSGNKQMLFLTMEDLVDTFEVVVFPEQVRKYSELLRHCRYYKIEGQVQVDGAAATIALASLEPASTGITGREII
jgi:DNA-directed DNA polymerase III PolC